LSVGESDLEGEGVVVVGHEGGHQNTLSDDFFGLHPHCIPGAPLPVYLSNKRISV